MLFFCNFYVVKFDEFYTVSFTRTIVFIRYFRFFYLYQSSRNLPLSFELELEPGIETFAASAIVFILAHVCNIITNARNLFQKAGNCCAACFCFNVVFIQFSSHMFSLTANISEFTRTNIEKTVLQRWPF